MSVEAEMNDASELREHEELETFEGEGYNEEEDEDFDPTKERLESRIDDSDDGDLEGQESVNHNVDYSKIESEQGGLIRTRHARKVEEEMARNQMYESLENEGISQSTQNLWQELQDESSKRLQKGSSVMSDIKETKQETLKEELVLIDRTYKFAGEIIHEKKWVSKSSAEAQEYLKSLKFKNSESSAKVTKVPTNENGIKLRRPLKRQPLLEQIIAGAIKPKLTTLEKSKMDWARYVDKEGITDELTLHNKDGYSAKQDFLSRVEFHKDQQYRNMRKQQLNQKSSP